MFHVTLLGTACMVPTQERNVSATYIEYNGEGILVDCGEGTQRQMSIAGISRHKIRRIFISHWHADHVSGLMGLLQTIDDPETVIDLYGPMGTKEYMDHLIKASHFDKKMQLTIHESEGKTLSFIYEGDSYGVQSLLLEHGIPSLGFRFVEKDRRRINTQYMEEHNIPSGPHLSKLQQGESSEYKGKPLPLEECTYLVEGKILSFIPDTSFCEQCIILARDAHVLICESSYSKQHEEKAEQNFHLTSEQAAQIASTAQVERLVLTHISQRYKTPEEILDGAKVIFPNAAAGFDFMQFDV